MLLLAGGLRMWKSSFQFPALSKPHLLYHPQKTLPHHQYGFLTTRKLVNLGAPSPLLTV